MGFNNLFYIKFIFKDIYKNKLLYFVDSAAIRSFNAIFKIQSYYKIHFYIYINKIFSILKHFKFIVNY